MKRMDFDASHRLATAYGNFELIPGHFFRLSVAQADTGGSFIRDVILSYFQVGRCQVDAILEIFLSLVQCIVLIDILYIGHGL